MGNQALQNSYEDTFIDNYEFIKSDGFSRQNIDFNNNNDTKSSRLTQSLNTTPVRATLNKTQSVGFAKRQTRSETIHDYEYNVGDLTGSNTSHSVKFSFLIFFCLKRVRIMKPCLY